MNWKTTQSTDEKYVYLTVMRDVKQYCASGYCEIEICFYHFVALPQRYIKRMMLSMSPLHFKRHLIVDWRNKNAVQAFYRQFIIMLCKLNFIEFNPAAFEEAFSIFIQYIKAL